MSGLLEKLLFMRRAADVRRYHQHYTTEADTVGRHSYGVAMLVDLLNPLARKEVIIAALRHDLGELLTGDIPATAKRMLSPEARGELKSLESLPILNHWPDDAELTTEEKDLLKLADYFDGVMFCTEEVRRGNRTVIGVGAKYLEFLDSLVFTPMGSHIPPHRHSTRAVDIFNVLQQEWNDAIRK